jgi:hypothetical protein
MSISIDVRKFIALQKKQDKLQSRAKDAEVEKSNIRAMYDAVGEGALKLFEDALAEYYARQERAKSEAA